MLAAEHEEREVEASDYLRRELCKVRILEHCAHILVPASPQQTRRETAPPNGLMHCSKRGTPVEKPDSITSSAPTRPGRRNPTTSKTASVFSSDRCRSNRVSTAMNLLRNCRDECHKAIPVRHTYLRQRLGIHRVVLSDDAVELQDIGGYCVEFVIGQRFRF